MKDKKRELLKKDINKLKDFLSFLDSEKEKRINREKWQKEHQKV